MTTPHDQTNPYHHVHTPTQARLTIWQAVRQSWLIHPDWTVADHLAWLDDEAYDTGTLTGDPAEVVGRWLAEHRRTASMSRPADEACVYMVAGGDRVAVFDSADEAGVMATTMTGANLEPVTRYLTEAQWEQAYAVLRSQQPHVTVTDARTDRAVTGTSPTGPPADRPDIPPSLAARPHDARRGLPSHRSTSTPTPAAGRMWTSPRSTPPSRPASPSNGGARCAVSRWGIGWCSSADLARPS
ncbi:hypothetical protein [Verrucosispora sioxanthis]|uniref:hypothetical protein n=1 Tax=Verrucosispora sioxanthis TaxID=2499994 RepID=UPI001F1E95FF|nr:hypothetical protein [Verrucosispora sioxanthis]